MMKKFILAIATISLLGALPSCTSRDSKNEDVIADDGAAEGMAEDAGVDNLDESLDSEQTADTSSSPDVELDAGSSVAETATDDQLTIDSFGESADANASTESVPDANAQMPDPAPPMTTEPPASDLAMEPTSTGAEEIAPPAAPMQEAVAEQSSSREETDLDQPKPVRSLQKVASEPWKMGSKWVNGIYFARPGDSLDSISQTIYGDDRTNELKKINPTYNNRDVKPGDKVYYTSVVRPDDNSQIVTYFEEKNIPAKTYVSKPGDNIRKVSQELLGYPEAWKEVWAYNTVESKQDIGEGVELRYWEAQAHLGGAPSAPLAEQAPVTMPDTPAPAPVEDPMAQMQPPSQDLPPPPEMNQFANNDLPPPPPPMDPPPPPPPSMEMAPPPPPPPAMAGQGSADDMAASEQDSTLAMGAVAVAVLGALALIMVRRKRKQREMDQALGETHVG